MCTCMHEQLYTPIVSLKQPLAAVQCRVRSWYCTSLLPTAVLFPASDCGHQGCTDWEGGDSPPDSALPSNADSHLEMD